MEDYPRTLMDLERRFATEDACRDYLFGLRWPDGFVCPRCGGVDARRLGRGVWWCHRCRYQASVTAGTIFQDTRLALTVWFRAVWLVTSQKQGISALGIQRTLGLGSYKTAWAMLHKLRRAMVRPGRDRLAGRVEVDETYWGEEEPGVLGRQVKDRAIVLVAAQEDGKGIGRIRLGRVPDLARPTVHGFIAESIAPGSVVVTDGMASYVGLKDHRHETRVIAGSGQTADTLMPRVHRVVSLLKRWLLGTHQGAVSQEHLDDYLDEFTFRFNRRTSASRGKLFYRLLQQAVQVGPQPFHSLLHHKG